MVKFINKKLGIYDPHEAIFSLFEHSSDIPFITEGQPHEFRYKSIIFLILLIIIRNSSINYLPKGLDYVLIGLVGYLTIYILYRFFIKLNANVSKYGVTNLGRSVMHLVVLITLIALFV